MMMCAPAGKTMSESFVCDATPAPAIPPTTPPMIVPFLLPPSTRPSTAPATAPAPTLAASPEVTPRPLWIVSIESTAASMGYELPRTVTLVTLNVKVPGVRGLGAGFTAVIAPWTTEPAGITTCPVAFFTSSTTRAVNASPTLAVRDEIVSAAATSILAPTPSRAIVGGAGGAGGVVRFVGLRVAGFRVAGGGVVRCWTAGGLAGTSRIAPDDSAGANVKLRAVESLVWL